MTLKEVEITDTKEQDQREQWFEYVNNGKALLRREKLNACLDVTNEKKSVHAAETQNFDY